MGIPNSFGSELDICARVKRLGYAASQSVRLYGEEYEAVSDPFFDADRVALRVRTRRDPRIRTLWLPSTILHAVVRKSNVKTEQQTDTKHRAVVKLGAMLFNAFHELGKRT
jgi:hypothetical protein